jgi:hypothetical protein
MITDNVIILLMWSKKSMSRSTRSRLTKTTSDANYCWNIISLQLKPLNVITIWQIESDSINKGYQYVTSYWYNVNYMQIIAETYFLKHTVIRLVWSLIMSSFRLTQIDQVPINHMLLFLVIDIPIVQIIASFSMAFVST